jgi:TPP-dependent pyruvate/acetoin dehydrogenase alpha subunit
MDKKTILKVHEIMLSIRKFEECALKLFEENKLRGSVHLSIGQEAVAAATGVFLRDNDYITSTHRGHGHAIAKGARPDKAMAELMGKQTGYCEGRGGSMHIAEVEKGNLGAKRHRRRRHSPCGRCSFDGETERHRPGGGQLLRRRCLQ